MLIPICSHMQVNAQQMQNISTLQSQSQAKDSIIADVNSLHAKIDSLSQLKLKTPKASIQELTGQNPRLLYSIKVKMDKLEQVRDRLDMEIYEEYNREKEMLLRSIVKQFTRLAPLISSEDRVYLAQSHHTCQATDLEDEGLPQVAPMSVQIQSQKQARTETDVNNLMMLLSQISEKRQRDSESTRSSVTASQCKAREAAVQTFQEPKNVGSVSNMRNRLVWLAVTLAAFLIVLLLLG